MKHTFRMTLLIFLVFSINIFANENEKALEKLANQMIYAVKTDDYKKFRTCWAEPDTIVDYAKSLSKNNNVNQNYARIKKYFVNSRKQIKPFYTDLQKKIKEYGLDNEDIIYKSAEYKLMHKKNTGYSISSMKINFHFLKNPNKLYHIRIDDALKIFNKTWLFTDKPLTNIQEQI